MTPSQYQQDIFNAIVTTSSNIAVKATAGSGKTTTIVEASKLLPYNKKAIFVAFNKTIVGELKERLDPKVDCMTMHSLGTKCIFSHYPGTKKIFEGKQISFYILPYFEKAKNDREKWIAIYQIDALMKIARATMTEPSIKAIEQLVDDRAIDIELNNIKIAVKAMKKLYQDNDDDDKYSATIDFQDMIEMCVRNKAIRMPQYDFVFIDEAQDLSKLDQLFIQRLVKPVTGRKVIVGDERQAIYGFRGSDPNSFSNLISQPNTISLPLSISYRCAKSIVREAKKVYEEIEENESNEEGEVRVGKVDEIEEGDIVICRNTRPLFDVLLRLIENNKSATIMGKDIEKGLLSLLASYDSTTSCSEVKTQLGLKAKSDLTDRLKAKGIKNPANHPKFEALQEKLGIIDCLLDKCATIGEVEQFITDTFENEDRDGVRLMTIHKAKGLEANNVFVIERYEGVPLIPSKHAVTKEQLVQEKNLKFVAYTRAKNKLIKLNL